MPGGPNDKSDGGVTKPQKEKTKRINRPSRPRGGAIPVPDNPRLIPSRAKAIDGPNQGTHVESKRRKRRDTEED